MKNPAAVALGRLGGQKKSDAKTKACRENAKKPRAKRVVSFKDRATGKILTGRVLERHAQWWRVAVPRNEWSTIKDHYQVNIYDLIENSA